MGILGGSKSLLWDLWDPNRAPRPPQGCARYGPGCPPEAEIGCFTMRQQKILRKPTRPGPAYQRLQTPRGPLAINHSELRGATCCTSTVRPVLLHLYCETGPKPIGVCGTTCCTSTELRGTTCCTSTVRWCGAATEGDVRTCCCTSTVRWCGEMRKESLIAVKLKVDLEILLRKHEMPLLKCRLSENCVKIIKNA